MRKANCFLAFLAIVGLGVMSTGCSNSETGSQPSSNGNAADNHDHGDGRSHDDGHQHGDHDDASSDMKKMEKGLAGLSEDDRASAIKQHVCPVTGDMLGTMGKPIKVTVKDQEVWLCCNGCKKDMLSDPDKYLAKIKK